MNLNEAALNEAVAPAAILLRSFYIHTTPQDSQIPEVGLPLYCLFAIFGNMASTSSSASAHIMHVQATLKRRPVSQWCICNINYRNASASKKLHE